MRGSIVKRGKGTYAIVIEDDPDPQNGKRRQRWFTFHGTKPEAEKRRTELLHERDIGSLALPGKTTLADFLERWLQDRRANLSPKTAQGYESIIRQHLKPALGSIPLTQLRSEQIQHYYSEMLSHGRCDGRGALSPTTVSHIHMCLHKALKTAVRWHIIVYNPADADAVEPPHPQTVEMQTMDDEEREIFLDVARSTGYYCLFYLSLMTGARRGELLALRWSDVDLLQGEIHITRSVIQLNDRRLIYKAPKTAKGKRMISLSPSTTIILRKHKEERQALCAMAGIPFEADSLVFCHPDGSSLLPDSITRAWAQLVKRAGIKHVRLHDARHTHATMLLSQNVHPKIVQERLGHANIQTTLNTYSHVTPAMQEAAAAKLDDIVVARSQERESRPVR